MTARVLAVPNSGWIATFRCFLKTGFSVDQILNFVVLLLLSFVFIFGTAVNLIVFVIFYRRPTLRSISNRFVLSLTTANLISSMIVAPSQALRIGQWAFSSLEMPHGECLLSELELDWLCQTCRIMTTLSSEGAILSVLMIAIDRYCAVTAPLHYSMTVTRSRSVRMITFAWGLSLFYTAPLLMSEYFTQKGESTNLCWPDNAPSFNHRFSMYYSLFLGLCGFAIPFLILIWIYIKMYRAALKNSERTRRHSVSAYQTELLLSDCPPTPESNHINMRGRSRMHRKRSSNSSISGLFFREEGRAVKTGVIVLSSFITSWMPYYSYKILESIHCFFPQLQNAVLLLALSSSCTMPFIYVYRNETARKEALKVIYWWKDIPSTPTYNRSVLHPATTNGNSAMSVGIMEPKRAAIYSYTTECEECNTNQIVSSLKSYRPMSTPIHELRKQNDTGRENAVSFKLSSSEHPSRCDSCFRQDSESSASSDDPLIWDRYRFTKSNLPPTPVKWMKHRLSNGSVNTRSDSLASTNSSLVSYGVHRWHRRCSTLSTDSGGGTPKRKVLHGFQDSASMNEGAKKFSGPLRDPSLDACQGRSPNILEVTECHGYSNPFRNQYIYQTEAYPDWQDRYIWEIEECDGGDEESVVIEKDTFNCRESHGIPALAREMEDIQKLRDIRRSQMFRKRYSQQEFNTVQRQTTRFPTSSFLKPIRQLSRDFTLSKYLKNEENKSIKTQEADVVSPVSINDTQDNISYTIKTDQGLSCKQSDL